MAGGPLLLTLDSVAFDPERPHVSPEQLLRERGGRMSDPDDRHCCPCCNRVMTAPLFAAHLERCFRRNYHTIDVTHHVFRGATLDA